MSFSHKYNTDDSIIRANIVGLVNALNNNIKFENVWGDNDKRQVRVPWFYAMSGDERFLQDYFSNWSDCAPDFIEGNTDPIPRGTVYMSGYSVLSANLTSRYVRGYYTKEVEGQLKRFNSYINSIPIQMTFTAEILVDTSIDSYKIVQAITGYLYRTQIFSVNFMGFRVPTQIGFPDAFNIGKQFEFSFGDQERIKVTFDIELQSYLPIVDGMNEFFAGNTINTITSSDTSPILPPMTPIGTGLTSATGPGVGIVVGATGVAAHITNPNPSANTEVGGSNPTNYDDNPGNSEFGGNNWIGPE